jgi:gluconate 2-dehydrogenase gamma chain
MSSEQKWQFLDEVEATTVDAVTARIFPGSPEDPGAREANVVAYIDRSLVEYDINLQNLYRRGVAALNHHCTARFGRPFADLPVTRQLGLLSQLEQALANDGADLLANFFGVVREHTLEGMFSDPAYGGNRDKVGWRLIGFPGAQWSYSEEQLEPGFDSRTIEPMSLDDLRRSLDEVAPAAS